MSEDLKEKFSRLMYSMTKEMARDSFMEFLEENETTYEDWKLIKNELEDKYNVKSYI